MLRRLDRQNSSGRADHVTSYTQMAKANSGGWQTRRPGQTTTPAASLRGQRLNERTNRPTSRQTDLLHQHRSIRPSARRALCSRRCLAPHRSLPPRPWLVIRHQAGQSSRSPEPASRRVQSPPCPHLGVPSGCHPIPRHGRLNLYIDTAITPIAPARALQPSAGAVPCRPTPTALQRSLTDCPEQ